MSGRGDNKSAARLRLERVLAEADAGLGPAAIELRAEELIRQSKEWLLKPKEDETPPSTPRRPGKRSHRIARARGRLRARVILDHYKDMPVEKMPVEEIAAEAEARLVELQAIEHPEAVDEYEHLAGQVPARPCRRYVYPEVEIQAIRKLAPIKALEQQLANGAAGRPSCRSLIVAIYLWMAFGPGRPEVGSTWRMLHSASPLQKWALGPWKSKAPTTVYETLKAMLDRHEPEKLLEINAWALAELRKLPGFEDLGRYAGVDGTFMAAAREQRKGYHQEEELLRNGLDATFSTHPGPEGGQGTAGRGWTPLPIWDIQAVVPLAWVAEPFNRLEHTQLTKVVDLAFDYWGEIPLELLVGDREFDREIVCRELVFRYGVHPIFPRRGQIGRDHAHGVTEGVPTCSKHGLMKRVQADDFFTVKQRLKHGGPKIGELDAEDLSARIRWQCEGCGARATTRPRLNPRLYTFFPFQGDHRLMARRLAALALRNVTESGNFMLKHRGIAGRGVEVVRWVSSWRQKEWLIGGALLAITLRRLIHANGMYEDALREALQQGLIEEGGVRGEALPEDLRHAA